MRHTLTLTATLLAGGCQTAPALDSWGLPDLRQRDKQEHALGGALVGAATVTALSKSPLRPWQRALVGVAASALVGVAKEVYDHQHPRTHDCDPKDALATVGGGVAGGIGMSWTLRF